MSEASCDVTASCRLTLTVNGRTETVDCPAETLLVDSLRDRFRLTGVNVGCDTAQCGACTVLVDGEAVKSCNLLTAQVDGSAITTIEGLAGADGGLHPMQLAFSRHHALQCGYCTSGMIMRGVSIVAEGVPADEAAVRHALAGNLCRCTGYRGIVEAVCEVIRSGGPGCAGQGADRGERQAGR